MHRKRLEVDRQARSMLGLNNFAKDTEAVSANDQRFGVYRHKYRSQVLAYRAYEGL